MSKIFIPSSIKVDKHTEYLRKQHRELHFDINGVHYERFNEDWFLSEKGDMFSLSTCSIEHDRLAEPDWFLYMMKHGYDFNTFVPAFLMACTRAGIHTVETAIDYDYREQKFRLYTSD